MYNYGYRDYQPEAARFTTEDPIRDGTNWFAYVNNDPVNWIDLWGLEGKPTVRDVLTAITNPIGAIAVFNNSNKVTDYIDNNPSLFPQKEGGGHNNSRDAFRHAAWNALNARTLGAVEAKRFGDAHEANIDQPDVEREMDLHNNEVGRAIGTSQPGLSNQAIFDLTYEAMVSGKLITSVSGDLDTKSYNYGDGYKAKSNSEIVVTESSNSGQNKQSKGKNH
jgi:uncharacterized protein RhaS with RHS repeats